MAIAPLTLVPHTRDLIDADETWPTSCDAPPVADPLPLPEVVGSWRIHRRVGQGATASVFTVRCGRLVAVMKVERADATRSARGCIVREARWLRRNGGPGRPTLLDEGRLDDGRAWFVMTMAPGKDLSSWWHEGGRRSPTEAVRIIARAARIMGDTHRQGWIHRDLKPGNIAVGPDGEVTVLDWGLVHRVRPDGCATTSVAGTPGFIPPEMFKMRVPTYTPQLDTYALGCCLIVLLSRRKLWPHQLHAGTIREVIASAGITGISARTLEHILAKAVCSTPRQRWADGHKLAAELECWLRCMAPAPCLDGQSDLTHTNDIVYRTTA